MALRISDDELFRDTKVAGLSAEQELLEHYGPVGELGEAVLLALQNGSAASSARKEREFTAAAQSLEKFVKRQSQVRFPSRREQPEVRYDPGPLADPHLFDEMRNLSRPAPEESNVGAREED